MVRVYRKWHNKPTKTFFRYIRDVIVYFMPIRRLPSTLTKLLYGINPEFIFFVHPRRSEDIFRGLPFLVFLRRFLSKRQAINLISKLPPIVIGTVKTPTNINGLIISSFSIPEVLIKRRRLTLKEAFRGMSFGSKISKKNGRVFARGKISK